MEESKFLSLISNLSEVAKKDNWQPLYNKELDAFYWTKPQISADAKLTQFLEDFSLYITSDEKVEGLFIEYAVHNFNAHNQGYQPLFDAMTKKVNQSTFTVPKNKEKEIGFLLNNMADKVARETLQVVASGLQFDKVLSH
jgi:hypothetical protein